MCRFTQSQHRVRLQILQSFLYFITQLLVFQHDERCRVKLGWGFPSTNESSAVWETPTAPTLRVAEKIQMIYGVYLKSECPDSPGLIHDFQRTNKPANNLLCAPVRPEINEGKVAVWGAFLGQNNVAWWKRGLSVTFMEENDFSLISRELDETFFCTIETKWKN